MHRVLRSILVASFALAGVAHAAPTTPETGDSAASPEREERGLRDTLQGTENATGSRTIDLLIDMQHRGAGLQFNERRTPGSGDIKLRQPATPAAAATPALTATSASAARAELPPPTPSGLFGSGATPMAQSARTASIEPRGGAGSGVEVSTPRRAGLSPSGEPLPRWLKLPRELIEYVRENRWLVLSSVAGGLLLIWGLSALFSRAALNAGRPPASSGVRADHGFSGGRWDPPRQEARSGRQRSHRRPR